jgi:RES domain-containing protein
MVYTSTSLALAALEVFVHLEIADAPDDLVSLPAELPLSLDELERIEPGELPEDWRREGHPYLQSLGSEWIRSLRSLALLVPSVVIDGEWNVLVNPEHPAAAKIVVGQAKPFQFDRRMFK